LPDRETIRIRSSSHRHRETELELSRALRDELASNPGLVVKIAGAARRRVGAMT
jgi:hypothetical protein